MTENSEWLYLVETLQYNPLTGVFTSLVNSGPRRLGAEVGTKTVDGYIAISFKGKTLPAHRLAFFYMTGRWPCLFIDHIDRDRANNKWENLREADRTRNNRNRSTQKNNTSGVVGVSWDKENYKWHASICVNSKMVSLGRFESKEDAIAARKEAEKKYNYYLDKLID